MEVYRNTSQNVMLDIVGGTAATKPTATLHHDHVEGTPLSVTGPTMLEDGTERWTAYVPLTYTRTDTTFTVVWEFVVDGETATKTDVIEVVTPYASPSEIADYLEDIGISEAKMRRSEKKIRQVINSYTGQSFGQFEGTQRVYGRGDGMLILPARLVRIDSLNDGSRMFPGTNYGIYGDGFYLGAVQTAAGGDWVFENVIRDPALHYEKPFQDNVSYSITGLWGYTYVPTEVREAALILIEADLCPDSVYRDRQIKSVRYADTRLEYADSAFRGTGSLEADKLLEPYRRYQMTVI